MPKDDNNTTSLTIKEHPGVQRKKKKKKKKKKQAKKAAKNLLLEMGSAAISSVGQVLHLHYATKRLDGKPRYDIIDAVFEEDD